MSITLYHCTQSRSMRALWTLEEMDLKYKLVSMKFPPRYLEPNYKEKNPLGTVPFFVDGAIEMTESTGMAHYLVESYGPTPLALKPDEVDYGAYLNWLYRSDATLTFPQTIFLRYSILEPEEKRQPAVAADYKKWFLKRLICLDLALEDKRKYLCANRFTIADIAIGYVLVLANQIGITEAFSPQIKGYYHRLKKRPAFKRACI